VSAARDRSRRHHVTAGPGPLARLALVTMLGLLTTLGLVVAQPVAAAASASAAAGRAAAGAPPSAAPADGISVAATALQSAPLYIDPDMAWMFTSSQQSQIETALRASPVRVFLAAVPFGPDNDGDDYAGYFLEQLYRRIRVAGVYLAVGPSGTIYDAEYRVPRDIEIPFSVEFAPISDVEPAQRAGDTPGRILRELHVIATAPADRAAATLPPPAPNPLSTASPADSGSGSQSSGAGGVVATAILSLVLLGPLLALAGYAATGAGRRLIASRRGWGDDGDPGRPVGRMPSAPSTSWLLRRARGELDLLERLIGPGGNANPGWQRACDDYDVGRLSLTSDPDQIDLVGAIVLARDGRLAIAWQTDQPPPPCVSNPLHGRSVGSIESDDRAARALGQLARRTRLGKLPLCARCSRRAARGRPVDKARLTVGQLRVMHDGQRTQYYTFDSVWRDAAFGASRSGAGLPQAVREHLGVS
jgi:hypothetical protein